MPTACPSGCLRALAAALSIGIALAGCSPRRPDLAHWEALWSSIRGQVPNASALAAPDDRAACEGLLVAARRAREDLLPAPDPAMDAAVSAWIDAAGSIAFDCPSEPVRVEDALRELAVLEAEVEASRSLVHDGGGAHSDDAAS